MFTLTKRFEGLLTDGIGRYEPQNQRLIGVQVFGFSNGNGVGGKDGFAAACGQAQTNLRQVV
jgi:hypothetical protein